jgi:hypothetical protein
MFQYGEVISYLQMCLEEGTNLQRGMNYHINPRYSVILMSIRTGAPYADRIEDDGRVLIYEGHDVPKTKGILNPKDLDQPMRNPGGSLTQNGLFFEAAELFKNGVQDPELVRVYEKLRNGIWVFNGVFDLVDTVQEINGTRTVFKFKLHLNTSLDTVVAVNSLNHTRLIPSSVKLEVWKRDDGKCVQCGDNKNLHFDHIIPYSKGGTSLLSENIQLLCATCNLAKQDNIE